MRSKKLFSTKSTMTPDKYGEMAKVFLLSNIIGSLFLIDIFLIIILVLLNLFIYKVPFKIDVALFIVINIITIINLRINIYSLSRNNYIRRMTRLKLPLENESEIDFYENHLVSRGKHKIIEIYYKEVNHAVETDKNIYLKCSKYNVTVLLEKDKCSRELIEFINNKFFH